MANTIIAGQPFDPYFYANEALTQLEKQLGMAARVHRGYSKTPEEKGSTIRIPKPSVFTAQDAPSAAQDLVTGQVEIVLNKWKEVKFGLTDKELNFTGEQIIAQHIRPAAYALADQIDQDLNGLYKDIPWYIDQAGTVTVADILDARAILFNNKVPLTPGDIHFEIDGATEAKLLALSAFSQHQGAGDAGVNTQLRGSLGQKFGIEPFGNQNVKTHVKGTASVTAVAINNGAGYAAGIETVNLDAVAITGTVVPGDVFTVSGHTQKYAITNTVTAGGNALAGVTFVPGLELAVVDDQVVTLVLENKVRNIMFNKGAFALATAPLSDMANELGAKVAYVSSPESNLSLRSRVYYEGANSKVFVALDILYGVKTLNPNLAVLHRS